MLNAVRRGGYREKRKSEIRLGFLYETVIGIPSTGRVCYIHRNRIASRARPASSGAPAKTGGQTTISL